MKKVSRKSSSITANQLAKSIARLAAEKKAGEIVVMNMKKVANFCDYFVICSGQTGRQVRAIAEGIEEGLAEKGISIAFKQGVRDGHWILLDLGPVVAHIFDPETRDFYRLEYLWQDAQKVRWRS